MLRSFNMSNGRPASLTLCCRIVIDVGGGVKSEAMASFTITFAAKE
jgi:hypothetical protein